MLSFFIVYWTLWICCRDSGLCGLLPKIIKFCAGRQLHYWRLILIPSRPDFRFCWVRVGGTISILPLVLRCSPYSWFVVPTPKVWSFSGFRWALDMFTKDSSLWMGQNSNIFSALYEFWNLCWAEDLAKNLIGTPTQISVSPFPVTVPQISVNLATHNSDLPSLRSMRLLHSAWAPLPCTTVWKLPTGRKPGSIWTSTWVLFLSWV